MKNILLIEDDINIREGITALLTSKGYLVAEAVNGKNALEKIKEKFPSLVVSDIMMPEMDGVQFYKEFKESPESVFVPFIFLTAKADREDVRMGMNMGADDYITKPFSAIELLEAIESKLSKKRIILRTLFEIIAYKIPDELRSPLVNSLGCTEVLLEDIDNLSHDELIKLF